MSLVCGAAERVASPSKGATSQLRFEWIGRQCNGWSIIIEAQHPSRPRAARPRFQSRPRSRTRFRAPFSRDLISGGTLPSDSRVQHRKVSQQPAGKATRAQPHKRPPKRLFGAGREGRLVTPAPVPLADVFARFSAAGVAERLPVRAVAKKERGHHHTLQRIRSNTTQRNNR